MKPFALVAVSSKNGPPPWTMTTGIWFANAELDAIVREQLQGLPDKYRLPLVYATLDELDYQTIAVMLKVKPGTVKTLVFRGRQLLRARVEAVLDRRRGRSHAT